MEYLIFIVGTILGCVIYAHWSKQVDWLWSKIKKGFVTIKNKLFI